METRDKYSTIEQYDAFISVNDSIAQEVLELISRLEEAERNHIQYYPAITNAKCLGEEASEYGERTLRTLIAKYSKGEDIEIIRSYLQEVTDAFIQNQKYKGGFSYDHYIWALSIVIILDVENQTERVFKSIPLSNDYLINYLISSQISSLEMPACEKFYFELPYRSTKEVIDLAGQGKKEEAVKRLKKYLTREWYRGNAELGWHNDHKSKFNLHFGYWSFESGALVKILGLDDSSLKGLQYYPYDMVHWNDKKTE